VHTTRGLRVADALVLLTSRKLVINISRADGSMRVTARLGVQDARVEDQLAAAAAPDVAPHRAQLALADSAMAAVRGDAFLCHARIVCAQASAMRPAERASPQVAAQPTRARVNQTTAWMGDRY